MRLHQVSRGELSKRNQVSLSEHEGTSIIFHLFISVSTAHERIDLVLLEDFFCNSAITKPVVCARIMVVLGSHLTKMVPVLSYDEKVSFRHCVISQELFLSSVKTLSQRHKPADLHEFPRQCAENPHTNVVRSRSEGFGFLEAEDGSEALSFHYDQQAGSHSKQVAGLEEIRRVSQCYIFSHKCLTVDIFDVFNFEFHLLGSHLESRSAAR